MKNHLRVFLLTMTSSTIKLFSKLQNFRKYFRNWHFFRKISKDLSNFESIFEKNVNFESIFEKFGNFESIFEKNVNFEKFSMVNEVTIGFSLLKKRHFNVTDWTFQSGPKTIVHFSKSSFLSTIFTSDSSHWIICRSFSTTPKWNNSHLAQTGSF